MTLPVHLNALRAFEASARHQSFAAAAAELNVTPAAVGQLVRTLEDWLGTPLFHRATSGRARLTPTEAAERALPDLRAGFDRLSLALERLKQGSASGVLTVTVSPAFAAKWLLPRLESFQAAWPDTDVRLDTSLKPVDFVAQRIDIGVRYGTGHWPGLKAEKLMEEEVYPVCSPAFAGAHRLRGPADLTRHTLIHDLVNLVAQGRRGAATKRRAQPEDQQLRGGLAGRGGRPGHRVGAQRDGAGRLGQRPAGPAVWRHPPGFSFGVLRGLPRGLRWTSAHGGISGLAADAIECHGLMHCGQVGMGLPKSARQ